MGRVASRFSAGLLAALLLAQAASADKLRDFAKKASGAPPDKEAEKPKTAAQPRTYETAATRPFGTGTLPSDSRGESFLGGFYAWLVASPFAYRHGDPAAEGVGAGAGGAGLRFPEHRLGEATVPYARIDCHWQHIDADIDANDVRVELGYKALAVHGRTTMFTNSSTGYDLDINQLFGVLRYGGARPDFLPGTFEAGIGLGVSQAKDDGEVFGENTTGAFTFPLKYHPAPWCGLEFRPAWYAWAKGRRVGDYDLSASLGRRFVQVRGGYRWLVVGGAPALHGPYAGLSAAF